LLHGFPTCSYDWAALWPALTRRFRVIAFDMLGFGFSAKPWPHAYSIAEQADLAEAVLAHAGVTAYQLLAHDYGDTVAQELLARQREGAPIRITGVRLLNGGLFPETHRPLPAQRLLASPLGPLVARVATRRTFSRGLRQVWGQRGLDDVTLDAMWYATASDRGTRVMAGLIGYMDERRRFRDRWVGALAATQAPVIVIVGAVDPVSGAHMAAHCRRRLPNLTVVELPGVGHYPHVEAPEQVLPALDWQLTPT
jgi:pimeloyl-ACP methyl ester carboxylesterase